MRIEQLFALLSSKHIRPTIQRRMIAMSLLDASNSLSVESVHALASKIDPTLSLPAIAHSSYLSARAWLLEWKPQRGTGFIKRPFGIWSNKIPATLRSATGHHLSDAARRRV